MNNIEYIALFASNPIWLNGIFNFPMKFDPICLEGYQLWVQYARELP